MNTITLNETPLRTSRNFGINNIKLENITIPFNLQKFENITIIKEQAETAIEERTLKNSNIELKYGIGKEIEKNIKDNSNSCIKIENTKKDNIQIIYEFDEENLNLAGYIEIYAKNDINIIIEYKSKTDVQCFCNNIIRLTTYKNTNVNIAVINLVNNNSNVFTAIENQINTNSNVNYTIIDLGGQASISNYYSNIIGDNSKNTLKSIYLGSNSELKDLNYIAEIIGKNSEVDIDTQGALKGHSKKNFKGTIEFKKGCSGAKGSENEFCLLLSDKAKSIALPMLLCTEDDVEGEHSTASGKVDESQLFYLMSRGLSKEEATKLIVKSHFNSIVNTIIDEQVKQEVFDYIDTIL